MKRVPGRRQFLRLLGEEVLQAAGTLLDATAGLQPNANAMLTPGQIAGLDDRAPGVPSTTLDADQPTVVGLDACRLTATGLILVDQRSLPGRVVELTCHSGIEVAAAIRDGVARGGPALAQIGAFGVAITAAQVRPHDEQARRATLRGTIDALRSAQTDSRPLEWAIDRMLTCWRRVGELSDGEAVYQALLSEAERIASDMQSERTRLADYGAAELESISTRPDVLVHGPIGALAGGGVLAMAGSLTERGCQPHVWVTEGRPTLQGSRITCLELEQARVPHTLIVDAAVGRMIAARRVDAVVGTAERVARNGDVAAIVGMYPIAAIAARHDVPVFIYAPTCAFDPIAPAGWAFLGDDAPSSEVTMVGNTPTCAAGTQAANPVIDVTPSGLISGLISGIGVLRHPFQTHLATVADTRSGDG